MRTKLQQVHEEQGQSPWLDNLTRGHLLRGELERLVAAGIRGVTSNPTIFAKAIGSNHDYDEQFERLVESGFGVTEAYWTMVIDDIRGALAILRPVHDMSDGIDGYVSVELAPALARDTIGSIAAARELHERISAPNLFVKIPATPEGVPAIRQMIAEGRDINVTLVFSLERYEEVIEAYLSGLESHKGDLDSVRSVASFFVSRVDTEVDRRLEAIGSPEALALRGRAAIAQARLAYQIFRRRFSGRRWQRLARRGARVQRPLWASTSTKNESYPDTLYVDALIGPDSINTLPESTIAAFEDHGAVGRTIDDPSDDSQLVLKQLEAVGVSMSDVATTLEEQGAAVFTKSFDDLLETLESKRDDVLSDSRTARSHADVLGVLGIAISVAAYVPQVIHLAREHCSAGVSSRAWAMWLVSGLLVGLVAVRRRDAVFILLQLSTFTSAALILLLARRYKGMACETHAHLLPSPTPEVQLSSPLEAT